MLQFCSRQSVIACTEHEMARAGLSLYRRDWKRLTLTSENDRNLLAYTNTNIYTHQIKHTRGIRSGTSRLYRKKSLEDVMVRVNRLTMLWSGCLSPFLERPMTPTCRSNRNIQKVNGGPQARIKPGICARKWYQSPRHVTGSLESSQIRSWRTTCVCDIQRLPG